MKAIRKHPGQKPEAVEIENTLEALQTAVGGYIETVSITPKICIVCNEEGRLQGLALNGWFFGTSYVGTVIVAGTDADSFRGLTSRELKVLLSWMEVETNGS